MKSVYNTFTNYIKTNSPVVFDADALNLIDEIPKQIGKTFNFPFVLATPIQKNLIDYLVNMILNPKKNYSDSKVVID